MTGVEEDERMETFNQLRSDRWIFWSGKVKGVEGVEGVGELK